MATESTASMTYKDAGVDINAGEDMVRQIGPMVKRTFGPRVMGSFGGFAGMFRLDYNEELFKRNYTDPVLVACTDGVGTKLKVAIAMKKVDTVGIDLVAMSINDLICCGAEPLFFLDYLAAGKLDSKRMADIVKGVAEGCTQSGCALLGGETAEMPDMYKPRDFDMAGFAVGVVERGRVIDGSKAEVGDVAIAIASSGLHSNGYGLARRVLLDRGKMKINDRPAILEGASVGEVLLCPTRIYARNVLSVVNSYRVKHVVRAMANITGGGLGGNLPRVLPEGLTVRIKRNSWPIPPIFKLIAKTGPVDPIEMARVFNMGVGFVMIVSKHFSTAIMNRLRRGGERCWVLGKVRAGGPELMWT